MGAHTNENGEACHAVVTAGKFVRDTYPGVWRAHRNNRRCNDTDETVNGRTVINEIGTPATIQRCAAKLIAGNEAWTNPRHCWYASNQGPSRGSVKLYVGIKCASLSQIRRGVRR